MSLRLAAAAALGLWVGLAPGTAPSSEAPAGAHPEMAIDALAAEVGDRLAAAHAEPPVAVWLRGESPELARAFATVLSSELARRRLPAVVLDAPGAEAVEQEARAAGARCLLRLTLSLEGGLLHARGDLLGTWVNFWSGSTPTRPVAPAAGIESSVQADAHALALAAVGLPSAGTSSAPQTGEVRLLGAVFARLPAWTAALAAGDLDGDGRAEVVALTDHEVLAFAPDGRLLARRELRTLPPSSTPCREPFGALAVLSDPPRVAWLSSQKAHGEVLALQGKAGFQTVGEVSGAPLAQAGTAVLTGKLTPGQNTFDPAVVVSGAGQLPSPRPFTTLSAFAGPNGSELALVFPDGGGTWRQGLTADAPSEELRGLGAATALADVDGDGTPELVTTEPDFSPDPEVLRVLRALSLGPVNGDAARFRAELPRGKALQVVGADLDGDHAQELILAVWMPDGTTELQVFRRVR